MMCCAQPEKVIIDTDCAWFNDDAAALAMLLQKPKQVEVLGLTLVPGNLWPAEGSAYMHRILEIMKRTEIPMLYGAQMPLVHTRAMAEKENKQWGPIGFLGALGSEPPPQKLTAKHAVDY